jgi:hypothetical protein
MQGDGKLGYEGMELIWVITKHDVEMVHKVLQSQSIQR